MVWNATNFDWNRAKAFLVAAEEGSLSAAAKVLGMTQPTLGRQVTALEEELGVVLFERLGRGLLLTAAGHELLKHVRLMQNAAAQMALTASRQSDELEGRVTITSSEVYAKYLLAPIIAELRLEYPRIEIDVFASNSIVDLVQREADIAIRNAAPTQPDLIAKRLRDDRGSMYATPEYVERIGRPSEITQLRDADFIGFGDAIEMIEPMRQYGLTLTPKNFPVHCANHLVYWELVRNGIGIGMITTSVGDFDTVVQRVLPKFDSFVFPIWLVAHRELITSRRVRIVYDRLAERIGSNELQYHV